MLDVLISSKTRQKLLVKFFLFEGTEGYLRSMEREFHESSNSIRLELKKFIDAGLLISRRNGKKRYYRANTGHLLYNDIHEIVKKEVGIKQILECSITNAGNLQALFITGKLAMGIDSDTIELALVGRDIDYLYINKCVASVETIIKRKIMYLAYTPNQMEYFFRNKTHLVLWKSEDFTFEYMEEMNIF